MPRYSAFADNIVNHNCGPQSPVNLYDLAPTDAVNFWQGWQNNNPDGHARITARPLINGQTPPIQGLNNVSGERLVDDHTYEVTVGPGGATNTVGCLIAAQDLPQVALFGEQTVEYGTEVLNVEQFSP